jgi:glycosyltransferase involved in cell wall biosynthesis
LWSWLRLTQELRRAEAVIIQRKLLPRFGLQLLRGAARTLLFDFDDAVFLRNSYSAKGLYCPRRLRRFQSVCRAADIVIAGNDFLHDEALCLGGASRAVVIPTCLDPGRYPIARHERAGAGVELVWVGSSSTLQGLEAIRPLLSDLGRRRPGLRLKLVCDRFLQLDALPVTACPWSEEGEAAALAAADIGISWMPDDHWSRGKCGLKVLQYMAAGLPVVANPVGMHAILIQHGENGFLADTPDEWTEAVSTLARDPALRRRLGHAGRRRLEAEYSLTAGASRWLALLDGLHHRRAAA